MKAFVYLFIFLMAGLTNSFAERSPYEVLGVSSNASERDIKLAHRALAHKYHQKESGTGNVEKFREVQEAYEKLRKRKNSSNTSSTAYRNEGDDKTNKNVQILVNEVATEPLNASLLYKIFIFADRYVESMVDLQPVVKLLHDRLTQYELPAVSLFKDFYPTSFLSNKYWRSCTDQQKRIAMDFLYLYYHTFPITTTYGGWQSRNAIARETTDFVTLLNFTVLAPNSGLEPGTIRYENFKAHAFNLSDLIWTSSFIKNQIISCKSIFNNFLVPAFQKQGKI